MREHDHDHEQMMTLTMNGAEATPGKPGWMEHWNLLTALFILAVLYNGIWFKITLSKPIEFAANAVAYLLVKLLVRMAFGRLKEAIF